MKRKLWIGLLFVLALTYNMASRAGAVSRQSEPDFMDLGQRTEVTVSTLQFTLVTATTAQRPGVIATMIGMYGSATSEFILRITTDTLQPQTTAQGFSYPAGSPPWIFSISNTMNIWAVVNGTTTQKMFSQDLK